MQIIEHDRIIGIFIGHVKKISLTSQPVPHDPYGQMNLNNCTYQGSFYEGLRKGFGRIKYANGDVFYGQFENNEA